MEVSEGERVTVRVSSRRPVRARLVDDPLPGLDVSQSTISAALGHEDAGVTIAASRHGEALSVSGLDTLAGRIEADGTTVVFGAPERGLPPILGVDADAVGSEAVESGDLPGFDLWVNSIPNQGSETVRTEEAMFATLACLTLTR
jgi:predicted SPOUT superfamily RNA methylase MTH1